MPDTLPAALRELATLRPGWFRFTRDPDRSHGAGTSWPPVDGEPVVLLVLRPKDFLSMIVRHPERPDGLGVIHLALLALAREERMGGHVDQNEPERDGSVIASARCYRWRREPSGGLLPFENDLSYEEHACPTTALALALTAALRDASPQGGDTP